MGQWETILETMYAMGVIDKIYVSNGGPMTIVANDSTTTTVINKTTDPNFEFIIKRFVLWCDDVNVTFKTDGYGPPEAFSATDDPFDLGFTLRPVDTNVTLTITNSDASNHLYQYWMITYKLKGTVWQSFVQTFLNPLVKMEA